MQLNFLITMSPQSNLSFSILQDKACLLQHLNQVFSYLDSQFLHNYKRGIFKLLNLNLPTIYMRILLGWEFKVPKWLKDFKLSFHLKICFFNKIIPYSGTIFIPLKLVHSRSYYFSFCFINQNYIQFYFHFIFILPPNFNILKSWFSFKCFILLFHF